VSRKSAGEPVPDFSKSVNEDRRKYVRYFLIAVGNISVVLALLGIFLPLLPTTPFLLLAAACFARSSEKFYTRLLTNPLFGKYIRDWVEHRRVPVRTKIVAITLIVLTMGSSIIFFVPYVWAKIAGALFGCSIIILILRQRSR